MQVANEIVSSAVRPSMPYAFFSLGTTIVIGLFTFFRNFGHSTAFISLVVTLVGILCIGFLCHTVWASYDSFKAIQSSEDLLRTLRSANKSYLNQLPRWERAELLRRARAMKPLHSHIGNFCKYDISAMFGIWNEIINQLLFLLSI